MRVGAMENPLGPPTLSRKRERERCSLAPGTGGEGWGEGGAEEPDC